MPGICADEMGDTKVICTASVEEKCLSQRQARWVQRIACCRGPRTTGHRGSGQGKQAAGRWNSAPRGHSYEAVTDMSADGEQSSGSIAMVWAGGTRTASIRGFIARRAMAILKTRGLIKKRPLTDYLAAMVSQGGRRNPRRLPTTRFGG
jgi:ribonuclease PH